MIKNDAASRILAVLLTKRLHRLHFTKGNGIQPGGRYNREKDAGAWSIPKGEYIDNEDALSAAQRECIDSGTIVLLEALMLRSPGCVSLSLFWLFANQGFSQSNCINFPAGLIPLSSIAYSTEGSFAGAGLTPGFSGLYQVNVMVPPGIAPGKQVPVSVNGRAGAGSIFMAIQQQRTLEGHPDRA